MFLVFFDLPMLQILVHLSNYFLMFISDAQQMCGLKSKYLLAHLYLALNIQNNAYLKFMMSEDMEI